MYLVSTSMWHINGDLRTIFLFSSKKSEGFKASGIILYFDYISILVFSSTTDYIKPWISFWFIWTHLIFGSYKSGNSLITWVVHHVSSYLASFYNVYCLIQYVIINILAEMNGMPSQCDDRGSQRRLIWTNIFPLERGPSWWEKLPSSQLWSGS